ncbi:MAG: EpsI family protein [Phycisphaerae bacterium]|nr:EpsI family protein [Phycisphaerae bacterium]
MVETVETQSDTAVVPATERLGADKPRPAWLTLAMWLAVVVCLHQMFATLFVEMWARWFPAWNTPGLDLYDRMVEGESYYTHGPLVPLVSLVIVGLMIRHVRILVKPMPVTGSLILGVSLLLHLASSLSRITFFSGIAFVGVLCGLVLIFWGGLALRRFWFPIVFLFFMVPLPGFTIADLNFHLKMAAAAIGVELANLFGVICARSGNEVFWGDSDKKLVVANVCNGLRTLISLLAFGALYAYICKLRGAWRVGLFAMSIGVALVANSLRILALLVVADIWDEEAATGWFHDTSGILIFVLAFLMMFGIEKAVFGIRELVGRPAKPADLFTGQLRTSEDEGQVSRLARAVVSRRGVACLVVLALMAGGAMWINRQVYTTYDENMTKNALPATLTVEGVEYDSYDIELSVLEQVILETKDYLCRRYFVKNDSGLAGTRTVDFSIVFSQDNRRGTHPPDLCLEGGGLNIIHKQNLIVSNVPGRGDVPCRELVTSGLDSLYVLYTYKCGHEYTNSFWKQQWVIWFNGLLDRNASGALIRVVIPLRDMDADQARQQAVAFMREGVPHLDRNLDKN